MSLLFFAPFNDHPLNVLLVRGRAAFLVEELGAAAGYADGHTLRELVTHEWAPHFEEDEDVAALTPIEAQALRREVDVPTTGPLLVLFSSGVEKALTRAETRHGRHLLDYLVAEVYPRVGRLTTDGDSDGEPGDGGPAAPPPTSPASIPEQERGGDEIVVEFLRLTARKLEYHALRRYAGLLWAYGETDTAGWLDLERQAVEVLLGRPIQALPPRTRGPAPASAANGSLREPHGAAA